MKTAKQILLLTGMVFFAAMLAGCEGNQEERSGYQIYYVNAEKTKTVSKVIVMVAMDVVM